MTITPHQQQRTAERQGRGVISIPSDIGEYLSYDPDTGLIAWTRTMGNVPAGTIAGRASDEGYLRFTFRGRKFLVHRVAFFLMTGRQPDLVDHHDLDKCNNAWANLREADASESSANRPHFRGKLKKGVRRVTRSQKFTAHITFRGDRRCLGYFDTEDQAHAAYVEAGARVHGEFARPA